MVAADRVRFLFSDARALYDDAIEMLDQGKIRNAAEKAWGATKRATDALVLAREGEEPQSAGQAHAFEVERRGPTVREPARAISHQGRAPARQLLLRRELRTGAGDGRPDTGHHPVHRPRREAFRRVIMVRTWCGIHP